MNKISAMNLAYVGGGLEVLLGIVVLVFYQHQWPFWATVIAMFGLWVFTVIYTPLFLCAAFNSTTINLAMVALSVIALDCVRQRVLA